MSRRSQEAQALERVPRGLLSPLPPALSAVTWQVGRWPEGVPLLRCVQRSPTRHGAKPPALANTEAAPARATGAPTPRSTPSTNLTRGFSCCCYLKSWPLAAGPGGRKCLHSHGSSCSRLSQDCDPKPGDGGSCYDTSHTVQTGTVRTPAACRGGVRCRQTRAGTGCDTAPHSPRKTLKLAKWAEMC